MPERSVAERRAVVEHLAYEVAMLRAAVHELSDGATTSWAISNALVEALALHTRNLVDFFYNTPNPRFSDDVLARDFVRDAAAWEQARPAKSTVLSTAKTRADKQVSHLTYARVGLSREEKAWRPGQLLAEIELLLQVFTEHASPEFLQVSAGPSLRDDE